MSDLNGYPPEVAAAKRILPAWFIERMMTDSWYFGLMLSNGKTIGIESINKVSVDINGKIWIDAVMIDSQPYSLKEVFISPTSRTEVTINADHIIAAFEIADT